MHITQQAIPISRKISSPTNTIFPRISLYRSYSSDLPTNPSEMESDRQLGEIQSDTVGVSGEKSAVGVADGDMTEDEKIERFYALIRSCKEFRDRQRTSPEKTVTETDDGEKKSKRKRSGTETPDRNVSSWIPAFKLEDFTENRSRIQLRSSFADGDRVRRRDNRPSPETDGGGLDLSLRL